MTTGKPRRYQIRAMSLREIGIAIDWAAAEGWNPGVNDAACFHAADPDGFLAGLLDDELVATISVVRYGASFGFLGLYIVKPAHRGCGYGLSLWNAGLAHLGQRTIGLDGVVAQQDNYRRSGFGLAYRNVRYQGAKVSQPPEDRRIVPLSSIGFDELDDYDRSVFLADRPGVPEGVEYPTARPGDRHSARRQARGIRRHPSRSCRLQDRAAFR